MSRGVIMLAAGGTGGHLFPAMALAQELKRRGWEVDLVTDMRGQVYDSEFPARTIHRVPAATMTGRSPLAILRLLATLARGVVAAYRVLRRVRPAAVAGFGGYPTFPPLIAARLRGVPALVHEQNAVMGRANRVLQRFSNTIALSAERTRYAPAEEARKVRITGNPVRDAVIAAGETAYSPPETDGEFRLLVFGGSQGARYFADALPQALGALPADLKARLRVVQQARTEDLARLRDAYAAADIEAELAAFFADLPERMAAAHLIIARSGASTVAELAVLGRPAILVPFSHAIDNDQLENARRLAEAGGAWCLPEPELTPAILAREIERLAADPDLLVQAARAARARGRPDAVKLLADAVETLAQGGR